MDGVVDSGWFSGEPGWDLAVAMAPVAGGPAVSGCQIPGIGWVEAATVAGICSTFPLAVARALLDSRTGTVVETTTNAYRPSRAIRRHVQTRDGTCRMWGCTRPVDQCDLDHAIPWPTGRTTPANLTGLCRRHHRMKQHARWAVHPDFRGGHHLALAHRAEACHHARTLPLADTAESGVPTRRDRHAHGASPRPLPHHPAILSCQPLRERG